MVRRLLPPDPAVPYSLPTYTTGFVTKYRTKRTCARRAPGHDAVPANIGHNELLGGHGDDRIHAGPRGDVLWGDYHPCCQPGPRKQQDVLVGGPGDDFIYGSHGRNRIVTGGGDDVVHDHFGRGTIDCSASEDVLVFVSHASKKRYKRVGGCRTTFRSSGTQPAKHPGRT